MVTESDIAFRTNSKGEEFIALVLQGDLEMVQCKESGHFYATTRRSSVASRFDEQTAMRFIGNEIQVSFITTTIHNAAVKRSQQAFRLFWEHWDKSTIGYKECFSTMMLNKANLPLG